MIEQAKEKAVEVLTSHKVTTVVFANSWMDWVDGATKILSLILVAIMILLQRENLKAKKLKNKMAEIKLSNQGDS